jgi:hypothetical protein
LKKKEVAMNVPRPQPKSPALLSSVLAALLLLPIVPSPARAERDCLQMYVNCVVEASDLDGVPRRSWAGIRCAYDLIACLQQRLV